MFTHNSGLAKDRNSVKRMRMVNMGSCTPVAKHHLSLRSLFPPVCRRLFPEQQHNGWKGMRQGRQGRGSRIIVGGLFAGHGGDGCARASDLDLHAAAVRAASIRFQESQRPDPLLIDLYAGCLLSTGVALEDGTKEQYPLSVASSSPCHYTLATKFIDDKLLSLVSRTDEVKQNADCFVDRWL